jgi:hypothetical protein
MPDPHKSRWALVAVTALVLSGCGAVKVRPEPILPKPLIEPIPTGVGLVIPEDMRNYTQKETRWGVDWVIALGPGQTRLMHDLFNDSFTHVEEFKDVDSARAAKDLKAIFEPRIDQYSFVTARETGGRYYAVTIRYRVDLYTPTGAKADTFTLTGYGNALAKGLSSSKPLVYASVAAMRDAAAKFLVQFPDHPVAQLLAKNQAVTAAQPENTADNTSIEAIAIDDPISDAGVLPTAYDTDSSSSTPSAGSNDKPANFEAPASGADPANGGDRPANTTAAPVSGSPH